MSYRSCNNSYGGVSFFKRYMRSPGHTSSFAELSVHIHTLGGISNIVGDGSSGGTGGGTGGGNQLSTTEADILMLLTNFYVEEIMSLLLHYANGNFTFVVETLTYSKYILYSQVLFNLRKLNDLTYEKVRNTIINALKSLRQSVQQYQILIVTQGQLVTASEKANILDNLNLLSQYIEELKSKSEVNIIPDVEVHVPLMSLQPSIHVYIERYGYPDGGIFDPDLLAAIKDELGEEIGE